jgi:hypothetical protein
MPDAGALTDLSSVFDLGRRVYEHFLVAS